MVSSKSITWGWQGRIFHVKVLHSLAGVATQILVRNKGTNRCVLMDVGDGIIRDLLPLQSDFFNNIHTILITHGHFDHMGGLFSLLAFFRMIGRRSKLTIVCPKDVVEIKGIIQLFKKSYRDSILYEIKLFEISREFVIEGLKVEAFPVQHRGSLVDGSELSSIPAVGFILSAGKDGEKIVYTGDTGYFEKLKDYISNADFALIEGTHKGKTSSYHLSIQEAEELGKNAKQYLIIHKTPSLER